MKRIVAGIVAAAIALCVITMVGCKEDQQSATQGECVVSGVCVDATTSTFITGVSVKGESVAGGIVTTTSDAAGAFRVSFTIDSIGYGTITLAKTSYRDTTITVTLKSGTVVAMTVAMQPTSLINPGTSSGQAQTITFLGTTVQEVSVYGVGSKETAVLGWEVRDSVGLAIDQSHSVNLTFTSTNGPSGGEYISPATVATNSAGQAYTTFNSGTKSGVVQVTASATVGARTIVSSPVRLIINGGFPVQNHFSIAPTMHNFPALGYLGKIDGITVLVGDMYSNPVTPGTAVYFRSSAGVVQPSVFTNKDGFGAVNLYSGNPEPYGLYAASAYGNGYHWVVARTLGQGGVVVEDSTLILWSGSAVISNVSPVTFDIANAGSQSFNFRVADALGHPLSAGTIISVSALIPPPPAEGIQQNQVSLIFGSNSSVTLPDVIIPGSGTTDFSFVLKDGSWDVGSATPVNVVINVTGPNVQHPVGYTFGGVVH
jgi:hypothetical protein